MLIYGSDNNSFVFLAMSLSQHIHVAVSAISGYYCKKKRNYACRCVVAGNHICCTDHGSTTCNMQNVSMNVPQEKLKFVDGLRLHTYS